LFTEFTSQIVVQRLYPARNPHQAAMSIFDAIRFVFIRAVVLQHSLRCHFTIGGIMIKKLAPVLLLSSTVLLSGCMGALMQPSAEDMAAQQEMLRQIYKAQGLQFQTKQASKTETPVPVPTVLSEAELLQRINAFPAVGKRVVFTKKRDGLTINGKKLLDPEGSIKFFGFDQTTGDVTYLVSTGPDTYSYKYVRAATGMEPVKIADAAFNRSWQLTLVTGKKIGGDKLIPLGRGFVITRDDGSGFVWSPDKAMQSFNAPDGFQIADFQNGDIGGTRYILCERMIEGEESSGSSLGKLISATKDLGSTLGINNKEDYLLLNIDNGAVVSINISYNKKNVAVHSNCRATSSKFINKCDNIQFYDSLYDENGNPNRGHYFWAINWYNTSSGPLLIFLDNNGRELYAQNLTNNKKASILSRMLGINWFTATQKTDGTVSVVARMGFSNEIVENVESALAAKAAETVSQK
jgi:hypothetical protein